MPIRRKLEEAVPILHDLIDKVIKGSNTQDSAMTNFNIQHHLDQLREINGYFSAEKSTNLFHDLKETEDELLKNFTVLEEKIDNSKYAIMDVSRAASVDLDPTKPTIEEIFNNIKNVVSGFKGLPLKKSLKSLTNDESMAQAREVEEWSALNVEGLILKSPAMSTLQLNYNILDLQMKLCLLCFSIFPAKSVIKKRPLVYWWIGEGLVTKTKDKTAMEEGDRIFGELINKGFLIPQYKPCDKGQDKNPIVDSCKMHSWIRLMLIKIAGDAKLFDSDAPGPGLGPGTRSRSMCLASPNNNVSAEGPPKQSAKPATVTEAGADPDASRLLTLFNVNEQYLDIPHDWFSKENKIVVLQLGRWKDSAKHHKNVENEDHKEVENEDHIEVENEEFLKALGTKKHLKYLSLRGISRITEIPSTIRKLINLEILDLRACHNLEKLPSDISSLKKLTHLDISECYLLESMPKGLDKLSSLQVLKGFVVATSKRGPGKLGDVAGLKKLRKLSIYVPSDAYVEEAELCKLKDISALRNLSITWGGGRGGGGRAQASNEPSGKPTTIDRRKSFASKKDRPQGQRADISKMESLSFPQKLEKLDLWCIPCENMPAWLNPDQLKSLKRLYIRGGNLKSLSFEGNNKWNVRILRLKYLHHLKVDKEQLLGDFPRLIHSEIPDKIMEGKGEDEHGGSSQQEQEQVLNN